MTLDFIQTTLNEPGVPCHQLFLEQIPLVFTRLADEADLQGNMAVDLEHLV
jgi:hypothetical protein